MAGDWEKPQVKQEDMLAGIASRAAVRRTQIDNVDQEQRGSVAVTRKERAILSRLRSARQTLINAVKPRTGNKGEVEVIPQSREHNRSRIREIKAETPESIKANADRRGAEGIMQNLFEATITQRKIDALTRRIDKLKVEDSLNIEPTNSKLRLQINGSSYEDQNDAYQNYGINLPVLSFLSVGGSDDIWAVFQVLPRDGSIPYVIMSRIDRKNKSFDPTTQQRYTIGADEILTFADPAGRPIDVHFNIGSDYSMSLNTYGRTGIYSLNNPMARVEEESLVGV